MLAHPVQYANPTPPGAKPKDPPSPATESSSPPSSSASSNTKKEPSASATGKPLTFKTTTVAAKEGTGISFATQRINKKESIVKKAADALKGGKLPPRPQEPENCCMSG